MMMQLQLHKTKIFWILVLVCFCVRVEAAIPGFVIAESEYAATNDIAKREPLIPASDLVIAKSEPVIAKSEPVVASEMKQSSGSNTVNAEEVKSLPSTASEGKSHLSNEQFSDKKVSFKIA